jgi:hemerythrin-like domain-containing protein
MLAEKKDPIFEILKGHSGINEEAALFEMIPKDLDERTYYYKTGQVDSFIQDMNHHFQLEEDLVFAPLDGRESVPEELKVVVRRLRLEHEELKELGARVLEALLTEIVPVNEENRKALESLFKSYKEHLLVHARYEDLTLFPMLARIGFQAITDAD